jgi:hypothetical protein
MGVTPWQAGQRITADRLNQITPRWSSWTPTWSTEDGTNTPSYGNASINCTYCQTGDVVMYQFEVFFGSTTSFGAGSGTANWTFSAPVTASATQIICGYGEIQRGSTANIVSADFSNTSGTRMGIRMRLLSTTTFAVEMSSGAISGYDIDSGAGLIDESTPAWGSAANADWTSGSYIRSFGFYRAA